jgi:hypothetical protein
MTFDIRQIDLGKLNSMTKYPWTLTYHALGDKGVLQEAVQIPFEGRTIGTENVDGTNARLIFCPDQSVLVGNREDLLWERCDLIAALSAKTPPTSHFSSGGDFLLGFLQSFQPWD